MNYAVHNTTGTATGPPAAAPADQTLTLRPMLPGDAEGVAGCARRTYGDSYPHRYIYHPAEYRELLASGKILARVAVNPAGEVVAHAAIIRDRPDSLSGEAAEYMVDPRYRHHGLIGRAAEGVIEQARELGMESLYATGVTLHPYSQLALLRSGFRETGALLGFDPRSMVFKGVAGGRQKQRLTCLFYYLALKKGPRRVIYPPARHERLIVHLLAESGLARKFRKPSSGDRPLAGPGRISLQADSAFGQAFLKVEEIGGGTADRARDHLSSLR